MIEHLSLDVNRQGWRDAARHSWRFEHKQAQRPELHHRIAIRRPISGGARMRRRSFVALLAFAAAWLLPGASAGSAAPPSGSLTGTVLGPDGKAVAGARVFLQMSDARTPRTTLTDAAGHYSFRSLRSGLYELRAQAGGHWSDWKHNIVVRSGRETSVTLRLLLSRPPVRKASLANEQSG